MNKKKKNKKIQRYNRFLDGHKDLFVEIVSAIFKQECIGPNGTNKTGSIQMHVAFEFTLPMEIGDTCMDITISSYEKIGDVAEAVVTHLAKLKVIGFDVHLRIYEQRDNCILVHGHRG